MRSARPPMHDDTGYEDREDGTMSYEDHSSARGSVTLFELLQAAGVMLDACPAVGFAFDRDAFDVALPPLHGGAAGAVATDTIRMFAAMYLQAELEQAGVIIGAELLAQSRFELAIRDAAASARLERFAQNARRRLTRDQRDYLFARLFGLGRVAPEMAAAVNQDFMRLLLALCEAMHAVDEEARWGQGAGRGAGGIRVERARMAAGAIVENLSSRQFGNALIAGRQINEALREALAILAERGILSHFGARTVWDVLRRIFGELTPDLGRIVTRGQAGMGLMTWIADHAAWCARADTRPPSAVAFQTAAAHAAQWRAASGIAGQPQPAQQLLTSGVRA